MLTDEYRWISSSLLSPFVVSLFVFRIFVFSLFNSTMHIASQLLRWKHRHFVSIFLTDPFIKPKFYLHKLVVGQIIRLQFKLGLQQLIFKENIEQTLKIYCSYLSYLCCTFVLLFVRPSWPSPKNHLEEKKLMKCFSTKQISNPL